MKKKTLIIIAIIIIFLIVSASFTYYYSFVVPKKAIAERCENYVPNWGDFVECYGVIAINDGWDMDYLSLKDHVHKYEIARIYNLDQYTHTDEKIFVINRKTIEGNVSDGVKTEYYQELFQNGKVMTNYYNSLSDMPTYLIINYKIGEVEAYRGIEEVPKEYQHYFFEIKNK